MSAGLSPLIANEIARQRQTELARHAERARILGAATGRPSGHPLRTAVVAAAILASSIVLVLQFG